MLRCASFLGLFCALSSASGLPARAGDGDAIDPDLTREARPPGSQSINVLPATVAARVADARATATTWAGYDGARRAPLLTASVEARLAGRLAIAAAGAYTAETPGAPS